MDLRARAADPHADRGSPLPGPGDLHRQRPGRRAVHPRAEPLLEHGPLLHGRPPAPEGQVHGQVAALLPQPGPRLHLPGRRRVPGPSRPQGRGGVRHRALDPRPRRLRAHLLRGRALADRQARRGEARSRPPRAGVRRAGRSGRDPRLAERPRLEAARLPQGHHPVRRADELRARRRAHPRAAAGDRRAGLRPRQGDVRGARGAGPAGRDRGAARGRRTERSTERPASLDSSSPRSSSAPGRGPAGSRPAGRCGRSAAARASSGASCGGPAAGAAPARRRAVRSCRSRRRRSPGRGRAGGRSPTGGRRCAPASRPAGRCRPRRGRTCGRRSRRSGSRRSRSSASGSRRRSRSARAGSRAGTGASRSRPRSTPPR